MSDPVPGGLFDGIFARGAVREAVSDDAWLRAMLDFEAGLARAMARAGLIEDGAADAIVEACRSERFDIEALGRAAAQSGNPVVPLVDALTAIVGDREAATHVHEGATSQDVMDTAAMLVAHRALDPLLDDLEGAADAAATLSDTYRASVMAGRTLLQHALPITFGLKAAGWLAGLDAAADQLDQVRRTRLAVQLGGAAGTLASLGASGAVVTGYLAEDLGLGTPIMAWHTERSRVAEIAGALGVAAGAIGKPAGDIVLLAQTEVAEVREGVEGRGGSSTLPHKRNAIAAVSAKACAERAPGLVATLHASMIQEHERAAGTWHAEWRPWNDLLLTAGSAAAWLRYCLTNLRVDPARMRANLDLTGGLLLSERIAGALTPDLGRREARRLVADACARAQDGGLPLVDALSAMPEVTEHLKTDAIDRLLDPTTYLGTADLSIDRALAAHRSRRSDGGA